jgi:tripartite-type tricarboxylate transporter receptor subunit TctC
LHKLIVLALGTFVWASLVPPADPARSEGAKPIRVIISVPPGGSIDHMVRVLADHISTTKGQSIIIESRPGAGGVIAAEAVARAQPDGSTLLINNNGMIISAILRKVNYDPRASFEPICYLVTTPQIIAVNDASPYRTLAELVTAAREKPGELSIASVGPNTTQHIGIEQFKRLARANLTYVPYPGGAPAVSALLGGHVSSAVLNWSEIGEQLIAGKARARDHGAATDRAAARSAHGCGIRLPRFRNRRMVRPGRARKDAERNGRAAHRVVQRGASRPGGQGEAYRAGALSQSKCGAEFDAHIARQADLYGRLIRELNIKTE